MPAQPLTHHEILGLVEPFARRGRQVDLAATDRIARRLVFKPVELPSPLAESPPLTETLSLECSEGGHFKLTRVLATTEDLKATLQASGAQAETLLDRIVAVPPAQHFQAGPGFRITRSYTIASAAAQPASAPPTLILSQGVLHVDGLKMTLSLMDVRGVAGDITLTGSAGATPDFPQDLLAVQGWDWARLVSTGDGYTSKLRLRGRSPRRSRTAEVALEQAGRHLARVMAEPPAQFHQRHLAARWGVVLRRAIPSATAIGLIVMAMLLPRVTGGQNSGLLMALHYVPIAFIALSLSLQELARFEIPPLPRRPRGASWQPARPKAGAAAAADTEVAQRA